MPEAGGQVHRGPPTWLARLRYTPLHPAAMLAEIHRVLRPGGRLFFSMPFLYPIHDAPHDYQRWTRYGLRRSLADAGFCIRRFQRTMPAVRVGAMLLALAIAGGAATAARGRWAWMAITAPLVLVVNLAGWLLGVLLPDWEAMAGGYEVEALRP